MKLALLIAVLLATTALAESPGDQPETVEIPLDRIWAYNMPGTRQMTTAMRGRPPEYISAEGPLLSEIRRSLSRRPLREVNEAEQGFAVLGTEAEALQRAHRVFVQGEVPCETLTAEDEISAVFFSYTFRRSVHLAQVDRRGNEIDIRYRFVPRMVAIVTEHFALIPLGKLPPGKYRVNVIELPMAQEHVDQGYVPLDPEWGRRVVCRPFSFLVEP